MDHLPLKLVLFAAASLAAAGAATAQTPDELRPAIDDDLLLGPDVAVGSDVTVAASQPQINIHLPEPVLPRRRARDTGNPYDALGLRVGATTFFPSVEIGGAYTTNVAQTQSNAKSDFGLLLRPALRIESDWVRHSFSLAAAGEFVRYLQETNFDTSEADVRADFGLDIRRGTHLDLQAFYFLTQDPPSDREVPDDAAEIQNEHQFGGFANLVQKIGPLDLGLRAGVRRDQFDDVKLIGGGVEDNSGRNYTEPQIAVRALYGPSPVLKPFVELAYRPRYHDDRIDRNGLARNSTGYSATVGAAFDPSPIWSGDIGLIYLLRDYEDRSLDTLDAVGLTGSIAWRPSELTEIVLNTDTSIDETSIASSSGTRSYSMGLGLLHRLRDNIDLSGRFDLTVDHFAGTGQNDFTYEGSLGLAWRLNRWLAWTARYRYTLFDSGSPGSDYQEHRITAGIELRR